MRCQHRGTFPMGLRWDLPSLTHWVYFPHLMLPWVSQMATLPLDSGSHLPGHLCQFSLVALADRR